MSISLRVSRTSFEIGSPDFFYSFFSTICVRLEQRVWGSRFPVLMNELYAGDMDCRRAQAALAELLVIRQEFQKLAPGLVVWDWENLEKAPPWGDATSPTITSLANYFCTSDGKDLGLVLEQAFRVAAVQNEGTRIRIE